MGRTNHYRVKRPFWDIEHLSKHKDSSSQCPEVEKPCKKQKAGARLKCGGCSCQDNTDCWSGTCSYSKDLSKTTCAYP